MSFFDTWEVLKPMHNDYMSCTEHFLGDGMLLSPAFPIACFYADHISFKGYCKRNSPSYVMSKAKRLLEISYLDSVERDWEKYRGMLGPEGGDFRFSVYVLTVVVTINLVACLFLSIYLFLAIHDRHRQFFLNIVRFAAVLSSITLILFTSRMLLLIQDEFNNLGVVTAHLIAYTLGNRLDFKILDFIAISLLQFCQLINVTRLVSTLEEKRFSFIAGFIMVMVSNILYAVSLFSSGSDSLTVLNPFVYLLRIAISTSYAAIVISFIIAKYKLCFINFSLGFLSIYSFLLVLFQVLFFFFDLANVWINSIGEIFNLTAYVASTAIVWEWINRIFVVQKKKEAQSILGRTIYAEENVDHKIAKYALKIQDALTRTISTEYSDKNSFLNDDRSSELMLRPFDEHSLNAHSTKDGKDDEIVFNIDKNQERVLTGSSSMNQTSYELSGISTCIEDSSFHNSQNSRSVTAYFKEKLHMSYNKLIMLTDYMLIKILGQNSINLSTTNGEEIENNKRKVKQRIGLDKVNDVHLYKTTDIIFNSDDEDYDTED
ncbi:hypothetical protein TPHA_0P01250 [Tetrapisispora phaffii CBS 4417]|uniref:pH-response regulator protein palH/RIM21 n=1 Tax=Tetrapisispora phaffii (strain ATCC 24235 / CBS 4417 / NBRC 1672 / NRRL Y-8282 / UCD 70-5) TaxID=1071381 RepID=G8C2A5_TETPH|nr:hypothetical protein TPHA_0P01250 [Tetrapisispora phaffii CBS 4417]CCE66283.1 hypothetical protein TPHA_0P01250 [Tetrapisispora phaffii CBS 4417]